ncbi:Dexamethasone-induced Ras-related protein 1 [Lemmus lemmus]
MVILGSSKVGKTAIVSRFLTGRFEDTYTPTIEDFHRKFYSIRGEVYQLDILDTSGNHPFPAMRRLSILTGEWGAVWDPGDGVWYVAHGAADVRCSTPDSHPHLSLSFPYRGRFHSGIQLGQPRLI